MRIAGRTFLNVLVAVSLVALVADRAAATTTDPHPKDIRCRYKIMKSLIGLARVQMRVRSDCASRQAQGLINADINCFANPVDGTSTGAPSIDAKLIDLATRAARIGDRIGKRCDAPYRTPQSIHVDHLCDPPLTDPRGWRKAVQCGYDLMSASADRLFELTYRHADPGAQPISDTEFFCRDTLGQVVRSTFRSRIRKRVDCFRKGDKLGLDFNCEATAAWPGHVEQTGYSPADQVLTSSLVDLRSSLRTACGEGIDSMRFTENSRIVDYTASAPGGATFTTEDLFHRLEDAVLQEETLVVDTRMFPGNSYCGDGVIDWARGETCDDGNNTSCDGCDRDCTITACGNGAACGPTELCDDGNTQNDDGCNSSCQFETCGDGIVQKALGEICDDANAIDCDGCDSNCTPSNLCNNGVACSAYGEQCDDGLGLCLSGIDLRQPCISDADCRGTCVGGAAAGTPCLTDTNCSTDGSSTCSISKGCGGMCDGGAKDKALCGSDSECPGKCLPIAGQGQMCASNADCPVDMRCNGSLTCELSKQGAACAVNADCGSAGYCEPSGGCNVGNSDKLGDRCRNNCQLPTCGDGTLDAGTNTNGLGGEACDDGNLVDGDGCDSNCTPTMCGNGIVTAGEQCDLGPGHCAGGYDNLAMCTFDSDCRGYCFDQPNKPCDPATAIIDCSGQVCIASSGCIGGNADGTLCTTSCQLPTP